MPVEELRAHIIATATRVFAHQDFNGATIDGIAREAGITRAAVYELFKNKEDLFVAVCDDAGQRLTKAMHDGFRPGDDFTFRDFVRMNVALLFDFIEQHPDEATIIRIVDRGTLGLAHNEYLVARHQIEDDVVMLYEGGWARAGGISHEAARLLALMTLAMVQAVGFRQTSEESWGTAATIDVLTDFLVGGLASLARNRTSIDALDT